MCELLDKYENRGVKKGELRLASLIEKLLQSNRMEDLQKVISNKRYRERLYEEFGIL